MRHCLLEERSDRHVEIGVAALASSARRDPKAFGRGSPPTKPYFPAIILSAILLLFLVFGLTSSRTYQATRHPLPGAIANTVIFAWAIGVTFPMVLRSTRRASRRAGSGLNVFGPRKEISTAAGSPHASSGLGIEAAPMPTKLQSGACLGSRDLSFGECLCHGVRAPESSNIRRISAGERG
jgi:hypothetical protein